MLQTMTVLVMALVLETTLAGPQYGGGQQAQGNSYHNLKLFYALFPRHKNTLQYFNFDL